MGRPRLTDDQRAASAEKRKASQKAYQQSEKGKASQKAYQQSEKGKDSRRSHLHEPKRVQAYVDYITRGLSESDLS